MQLAPNSSSFPFHYRWISTLLLLCMLIEWLLPWVNAGQWSSMLFPTVLIGLTVVILGVGLFRPSVLTMTIIGFIVGIVALTLIFKHDSQSIGQWFHYLGNHLSENIVSITNYGFWMMSDELRTILLFTGWILLVPSLQSIVWQYQLSFTLGFLTICYLVVLHLGLGFDVWWAMIRVLAVFLILLAFTTWPKLQMKGLLHQTIGSHIRFHHMTMIALTLMIVTAGVMNSFMKPKLSEPIVMSEWFNEQFSDSINAWSEQNQGRPLQNVTSQLFRSDRFAETGYSQDDQVLGHSIEPSTDIVFYGWSAIHDYWRGESLATYTGRGWIQQDATVMLHTVSDNTDKIVAELEPISNQPGIVTKQHIRYITPMQGLPLFHSGTRGVITSLSANDPERALTNYVVAPSSGSLYAPTKDAYVKEYSVTVEVPLRNLEQLSAPYEANQELAQRVWEQENLAAYLQIPDQYPARVIALSQEVAGGGLTTRYDQVKAIENYLKENYTYSLNSRVPDVGADFADDFLFEQEKGYCVHFATAMVMMLRAQEIPARYVKGYNMGTVVEERKNEYGLIESRYEVTQQDAHAWVEVYFPSIGWVAFDPTPAGALEQKSTAAWLSDVERIKDNILEHIQTIGSAVSSWNTIWLIATAGALLLLFLVLLLVVPNTRIILQHVMLRRYTRRYQRYGKVIVSNKQPSVASNRVGVNDTSLSYDHPLSRQTKQIQARQKMSQLEHKYNTLAYQSFVRMVSYVADSLLRKYKVLTYDKSASLRQRADHVLPYLKPAQSQAITSLIYEVEKLTFAPLAEQQLPAPEWVRNRLRSLTRVSKRARQSISITNGKTNVKSMSNIEMDNNMNSDTTMNTNQ